MKHLIAIWAVFLLMGCQTNNNIPKDSISSTPIVEADEELAEESQKTPEEPKVEGQLNQPQVGAFVVHRPTLCGDAVSIMTGIEKNSKEEPVAFWTDAQYGHKVMMLRNDETKTVSMIEWPRPEIACFISVSTDSMMKPAEDVGQKVVYKRDLTFAP